MAATSQACACQRVFGECELVNPATNMIIPQPCGFGVNTDLPTHTHSRAGSGQTGPGQASMPVAASRLGLASRQDETAPAEIPLQAPRVNTSRCSINSVGRGKSPGCETGGPATPELRQHVFGEPAGTRLRSDLFSFIYSFFFVI